MPLKWSALRKAQQNRVTKFTAGILVGVPLLISVAESFGISLQLPMNIYAGYLSALFFVIGTGIYSLGVPSTISEYSDIHDFTNKRKPELMTAFPDKRANIVAAHLDETQSAIKSKIESLDSAIRGAILEQREKLRAQLEELIAPFYEGCVVRYLQKEWFKADTRQNKVALIFSWIFIVGGIALATYILIQNILSVFTHK